MNRRLGCWFPVMAALGLAGCQTLSVDQCQQANWFEVGRTDGLNGRSPRHGLLSKECSVQGVRVSAMTQTTYRNGHQDGLKVFCTPPVILEKALQQNIDLQICPSETIAWLSPYAQVGNNQRNAQKQLDRLQAERERLDRDLAGKPAPPEASQRSLQERLWQLARDVERQHYRLEKADADVRYWRQRAQQDLAPTHPAAPQDWR